MMLMAADLEEGSSRGLYRNCLSLSLLTTRSSQHAMLRDERAVPRDAAGRHPPDPPYSIQIGCLTYGKRTNNRETSDFGNKLAFLKRSRS